MIYNNNKSNECPVVIGEDICCNVGINIYKFNLDFSGQFSNK